MFRPRMQIHTFVYGALGRFLNLSSRVVELQIMRTTLVPMCVAWEAVGNWTVLETISGTWFLRVVWFGQSLAGVGVARGVREIQCSGRWLRDTCIWQSLFCLFRTRSAGNLDCPDRWLRVHYIRQSLAGVWVARGVQKNRFSWKKTSQHVFVFYVVLC